MNSDRLLTEVERQKKYLARLPAENHPVAHWQYNELGIIRFDQTQYEKALSKDPKYCKERVGK